MLFLYILLILLLLISLTPTDTQKDEVVQKEHIHHIACSESPTVKEIVVFTASWCPYCRDFQPLLDELIRCSLRDGFVLTIFNDTDKSAVAAFGVTSYPSIFVNGHFFAGVREKETILAAL